MFQTVIKDSSLTGESEEVDISTYSIKNLKYLNELSITNVANKSELTDSSLIHLAELKFLDKLELKLDTKVELNK